jgi:hypothetical protein
MDVFTGLERLSKESRVMITEFLKHRVLRRLGNIRQVGFTTYHQQTRLQHTLESLDFAAAFLEKVSVASSTVRNHLIAAIALEDVGRAPFSNSLEPIFTALPGLSGKSPIDVQRSIAVIQHLEQVEGFLSRHGLSYLVITSLLEGHVPWKGAQWTKSLISGPTDVDRLQYVKGDMGYAEGTDYDISDVARGLVFDRSDDQTIVDMASVRPLVDFLLQRTRLYVEVYYEPAKLALECVVRFFFKGLWNFLGETINGWSEVREPRSVEDFLLWTDATVLSAFEGPLWDEAPEKLQTLRLLIRDGGLQVAELRERGVRIVDLEKIDRLFAGVRDLLVQRENCWVLDTEDIPPIQTYHPGTIAVLLKGKYRDLAETQELIACPELTQTMRRCPLIIFPTADFSVVQAVIHETGLVLTNLIPVDGMKRFVT